MKSARRIAVAAMLVALSMVISMLPSLPGPITKFGGFPLLLGGLLVGPRTGFAVGCLADLIGYALHPTGWFFPGFTVTQGLTAMIPGLFSRGKDPLTWRAETSEDPTIIGGPVAAYARLVGIFGVAQLVTSVILVSIFTAKIVQGTPLDFELGRRALAQMIHVPVYAFLAFSVLGSLSQTEMYKRILVSRA